ncbi:MAG TPA: hypothetical protein VIT90_16425 [Lysobacter sp.]
MFTALAVVVVFLLVLSLLVRASARWGSSTSGDGWDPGYSTPLASESGCDPRDETAADAGCSSDPDSDSSSDSDSGGDCSSDGGSSD